MFSSLQFLKKKSVLAACQSPVGDLYTFHENVLSSFEPSSCLKSTYYRRHDHDTMLAVMLAAKLLRRLGHHERATEYFNTLLSIQEKVLGTEHAEVLTLVTHLCDAAKKHNLCLYSTYSCLF